MRTTLESFLHHKMVEDHVNQLCRQDFCKLCQNMLSESNDQKDLPVSGLTKADFTSQAGQIDHKDVSDRG